MEFARTLSGSMLRRLLQRLKVEIVYTNVRVCSTLSIFRDACVKRAPKSSKLLLKVHCNLHVFCMWLPHAKDMQKPYNI